MDTETIANMTDDARRELTSDPETRQKGLPKQRKNLEAKMAYWRPGKPLILDPGSAAELNVLLMALRVQVQQLDSVRMGYRAVIEGLGEDPDDALSEWQAQRLAEIERMMSEADEAADDD